MILRGVRDAVTTALLAGTIFLAPMPAAAGAPFGSEFAPEDSTMEIAIGGLPRVVVTARDVPGITLRGDPGDLSLDMSRGSQIWAATHVFDTALFTGVPILSRLTLDGVGPSTGFAFDDFTGINLLDGSAPIGPGFGGFAFISGTLVMQAMGGAEQVSFPMFSGGTQATLLGNPVTWSNGDALATVPMRIPDITTKVVTIPGRGHVEGVVLTLAPTPAETVMTLSTNGGFVSVSGGATRVVHTVTVSGTNALVSGDAGGEVTIVRPLRIQTNAIAGGIPGQVRLHFRFVPEPNLALLLLSGIAALFGLARLRLR